MYDRDVAVECEGSGPVAHIFPARGFYESQGMCVVQGYGGLEQCWLSDQELSHLCFLPWWHSA